MEKKYPLEILRHSASHIMAQAVGRIYKDVLYGIGPAIEEGFYYDFDLPRSIAIEDLGQISKEMENIIKEDHPFEKIIMKKDEAIKFFKEKGQIYKVELLEEIPDEEVSLYKDGEFIDLCRGPHIERTSHLKHFKLLDIAGAYWKGNEKNKMLTRIYGTAFDTKEELKKYLNFLEEAKKRDHRKTGRHLFAIFPEIGAGLVLWKPDGATLFNIIEEFWKEQHLKNGYKLVKTPHIASEEIYKISGHLQNYADLMYSSMDIEGKPYRVKPMNCPGHIMLYASELHSYRDLPLRFAELGTVYRFEKSGVLHGLLRVRGFTIDDAHIFIPDDQIEEEIINVFNFTMEILKTFGFEDFKIYIATKPEKSVGDERSWKLAEESLKKAVMKKGVEFEIDEGGGAFYGPKIDIKIKDAIGRLWQCSTIQFDFNLPHRFSIFYIDSKGEKKTPYMIHRAVFGSLERFIGMLTEHYSANFPLWLSPKQVAVLSITDDCVPFAEDVYKLLFKKGVRVEKDFSNTSLNKKIRENILKHIPYLAIIGKNEVKEKNVMLRDKKKNVGKFTPDELASAFLTAQEKKAKTLE